MNIEHELKKDGITIVEALDPLSITLIAKFVAEKFITAFPFYHFNYNDLFIKVSNLNMYIADIPEGMSEANYFYKNSSIYFKQGLSMNEMKELTIHEFIHHFQEIKNEKGILYRLGLCDFTGLKIHGMGMNEAAVQLLSSKILKKEEETVKYYGIEFNTISPSYYPLLCNLINQISYLIGEDILFDSTLHSNDKFKTILYKLYGKKIACKIEKNFDKILNAEEKIIIYTEKLQNEDLKEKEITKASVQVKNYKQIIQETFIETQNMIFTHYFNATLNNLYSSEDIEEYRKKLYNYKNLLGTTNHYSYFNDYYINRMTELDRIYESLNQTALPITYKRSLLQILLSKLSKLLKGSELSLETEQKNNF